MIKIIYFLFSILILFGLTACKNDLPKPTKDGKDTFGCKVNGNSWIPNGIPGPTPSPAVSLYYSLYKEDYTVRIYAIRRINGVKDNINIHLNKVIKIGIYPLNSDIKNNPSFKFDNYGRYYTYDPYSEYITTAKVGGYVNITRADTIARIVSGTFSFTAVDKDGKQVKITNGRFDLKR